MADNTTLNAATEAGGDLISTDDVGGGVKVQRVKVQHGADGTASDVSAASPLPVSDAGGSLTVDGSVTAVSGKTLLSAAFALAATGAVVGTVTGSGIRVYAVKLTVSAPISVLWRDGPSTALEGAQPYGTYGGYCEAVTPPEFLFECAGTQSLDLVISGTGTASGRVSYFLV